MATQLKGEIDKGKSLRLRLEADASAPRQARRAIETWGEWIGSQAVADLRAVVTELVAIFLSSPTSDASIEIRLERREGRIRGEIGRPDGTGGINGTGLALRIIGSLVEEWGASTDRRGAWFRLAEGDPGNV